MHDPENHDSPASWEESLIRAARKDVLDIAAIKNHEATTFVTEENDTTQATPTYEGTRAVSDGHPASGIEGKLIGHFRIQRQIASGGMGTIYEAVQEQPRRTVAVKVLKEGISSPRAVRRFEYESQILARLEHPGIAHVYEAGWHSERSERVPFFAMEFIRGARPIVRYAEQVHLSTRERIRLFIDVCEAVHHGHQRGIIHRDLKPSNILVDADGKVKIIDFGVARSLDSEVINERLKTSVGDMVGTLKYMSPEQCRADPNEIDVRSDIYSLGIVLFELLSGQLPYDLQATPLISAPHVICEEPPTSLGAINRGLRGDIETIVNKALEKDRRRRYQSALAIADDLSRFLKMEPILARPPSTMYRLGKLLRRRRTTVVVASILMIAVLAVSIERARNWQHEQKLKNLARDLRIAETAAYMADYKDIGDRWDGMVRTCAQALAADSGNAMAYAVRSRLYFVRQEYEKALPDCRRALQLDPENVLALRTCACVKFRNGEDDSALAMYEKALSGYHFSNDLPRDFHNRGQLRRRSGEYEKALQDDDRAVALRPDYGLAYEGRGLTRYMKGDLNGAIEDLERAASLGASDAILCYLWIWEIRLTRNSPGDRDAAEAVLKKAEGVARSDRLARGLLAVWRGRLDPKEHLATLKRPDDIAQAHYFFGVRALVEGRRDEAKEHFELAADQALHKYGEFDLAKWHLQKLSESQ